MIQEGKIKMETARKNGEILDLSQINELSNLNGSVERESGDVVFVAGAKEKSVSQHDDLLALNIASSFDTLTFEGVAKEGLSEPQLDMVVDKILSAITDMANVKYKGSSFIEPSEINQVKMMLETEKCDLVSKKEIEKELTKFQESIQSNYKETINQYRTIKIDMEEQVELYEKEKSKIVSRRVSQFLWPFNDATRSYDNKIYNLKCKIRSCDMKIEEISSMRPMAKEKDIIKFNMELKQKFSK